MDTSLHDSVARFSEMMRSADALHDLSEILLNAARKNRPAIPRELTQYPVHATVLWCPPVKGSRLRPGAISDLKMQGRPDLAEIAEKWERDCDTEPSQVAFEDAERLKEITIAEAETIAQAIIETPATDLDSLMQKACALAIQMGGATLPKDAAAVLADPEAAIADRLIFSIAADLLRMISTDEAVNAPTANAGR